MTHVVYTNNVASFSPPDEMYISLIDIGARQLTFNWSPATTLDCPDIHYNILSSNCGSCPTITTHTTVTCTDIPTDGNMCTFAVQTVICENITGNMSYPLTISVTETLNGYSSQLQTKADGI